MKRLFWSWAGKVGGTSFLSWLRPDLKIFRIYNSDLITRYSDDLFKNLISADLVYLHGLGIPIYEKIGRHNWEYFLKDSGRLAFIRNPIDRFESMWRSSYDPKRKSKIIPMPPILKYSNDNGVDSDNFKFLRAYEQNESERISINEFLDLWLELYNNKSTSLLSLSEQDYAGINPHLSKYKSLTFKKFNYNDYSYLFNQNLQFKEINANFSDSFFTSPRDGFDFLVPTENINQYLSVLFKKNKFMNNLLRKDLQRKTTEELHTYFAKESVNFSPSNNKNTTNTLNPKNRYVYSLLNKLDFVAWNSAMEACRIK